MVEDIDDEIGPDERVAANAEVHGDAWRRTLSDAEALADELEADGWDALVIAAGHTAPEPPDAGDTDRFGIVYVVPGGDAERFGRAFEAGEFPTYDVFRRELSGRLFLVTQLLDPGTETAVLLAGTFELRHAQALADAAREDGAMYTHVQKLDGTHLGTFRHDDYEKFFPRRSG